MNRLTWFGKVVYSITIGLSSALGASIAGSQQPFQIFVAAATASLITAFMSP